MPRKLDWEVISGFLEEARGYLPRVRQGLDAFRAHREQPDLLEEPFRYIHTIKGSSSMIGFGILGHVAYFIEETIEDLRSNKSQLDEETNAYLGDMLLRVDGYLDGVLDENFDEREWVEGAIKRTRRFRSLPVAGDKTAIAELTAGFQPIAFEDGPPPMAVPPAQQLKVPSIRPEEASMELQEVFRLEAEEHLTQIGLGLTDLDSAADKPDVLQEVRRRVHTLKGAASIVGYDDVARLAHRMEDLMDRLFEGSLSLTQNLMNLLHETSDCLDDLVKGGRDEDELKRHVNELYAQFLQVLAEVGPDQEPLQEDEFVLDIESLGPEQIIDFSEFATPKRGPANQPTSPQMGARVQPSRVLRVPLERLDELVSLVSEFVINRSTFERYFRRLVEEVGELTPCSTRLQRISSSLETQYETVMLETNLPTHRLAAGRAGGTHQIAPMATGRGTAGIEPRRGWKSQGATSVHALEFDSLEMDRYTEFHLLSRELTETAGDMKSLGHSFGDLIGDFESYLQRSTRLTSEIQEKLMHLRMVPFDSLAARFHRTVRVTAHQQGKTVNLDLDVAGVSLDKTVFEEIADPILHILRNAVDHGIEPPALRKVVGKPEAGNITIRARYSGTQVVIRVQDDGAGLQMDLIRAKIVESGLASENEAAEMRPEELTAHLFRPGFSTSQSISEISGRGVGMDVVKSAIRKMKGTVDIDSTPGAGATITIRLPLTLAVTRVLMVSAHSETYAIPLGGVRKILRLEANMVERMGRKPVVNIDGVYFPLIRLGEALGLKAPPDPEVRQAPLLIVDLGEKQVALAVDRLLEAREVVVKNLGNHLRKVKSITGATITGDGRVVLILNLNDLADVFADQAPSQQRARPILPKSASGIDILIVDDSPSVRRVLTNLVSSAGWNAITARDGLEALEIIQKSPRRPALVLLDIEMPRMDGFELTALLRGQERFREIPIIMLTSRAAAKHRDKAFNLGVNDYLVKPFQEENLIKMITQLTIG